MPHILPVMPMPFSALPLGKYSAGAPPTTTRDTSEPSSSSVYFSPSITTRPRLDFDSNLGSAPLLCLPRSASKRAINTVELKIPVRVMRDQDEESDIQPSTSFDSISESDPATPTPLRGSGTGVADKFPLPILSPPPTPPADVLTGSGSTVAFPRMRTKLVGDNRMDADSGSEEDVPVGENVLRTPGLATKVLPVSPVTPPSSSPAALAPGLAKHEPVQPGKVGALRLNFDALKRSYSEPQTISPASIQANSPMIRKKSGEIVRSSLKQCRSLSGVSTPCSTPGQSGSNSPIVSGFNTPIISGFNTPTASGLSTPIVSGPNSPFFASPELPLTLPPTPTKFVHFDRDLEHVKVFTAEEKPAVISRTGSPNTSDDDDERLVVHAPYGYASSEDESKKPKGLKVTNSADVLVTTSPRTGPVRGGFRTPPFGGAQQEWGIMAGQDLKLETLTLADDGRTVTGGVIARNLGYRKWIASRFTIDWWQTTSEVTAKYSGDASPKCRCIQCPDLSSLASTSSGSIEPDPTIGHDEHFDYRPWLYDRFTFTVKLSDVPLSKIAEKTIMMAVRYHVNDREIWDNNDGKNYRIEFVPASPLLHHPFLAATTSVIKLKKKRMQKKKEEFVNTGAAPTYISTGCGDRRLVGAKNCGKGPGDDDEELGALKKLRMKTKPTISPAFQHQHQQLVASPPSKHHGEGSTGWSGDLQKQLEKVAADEKRSKVRTWMKSTAVDSDSDSETMVNSPTLMRPRLDDINDTMNVFQSGSSLKTRYDFRAAWKGISTASPIDYSVPVNKSFPQTAAATSNPFYGPGNHGGAVFPSPNSPAQRVFASSVGGHIYPGHSSWHSSGNFSPVSSRATPTSSPAHPFTHMDGSTPKGHTRKVAAQASTDKSMSPVTSLKPSMSLSPSQVSRPFLHRTPLPKGSPRDVDDSSPKFTLDPERDYGRKPSREKGSYFDVWAAITNPGSYRTLSAPAVPNANAIAATTSSVDATTGASSSETETDSSSSDMTMDAQQANTTKPHLAPSWSPPNSSLASTPSVTSASSPSQSPSSPLPQLPTVVSLEAGIEMNSFLNKWCYYTGDRTSRVPGSDDDARGAQPTADVEQFISISPPDVYAFGARAGVGSRNLSYRGLGHGIVDDLTSGDSTPRPATDEARPASPTKGLLTPRPGTPSIAIIR